MAADLGYAGIAQKYFLASLTAYQSELKKLSWQIEGAGKQHINTSMKSAVIAVGSKLMEEIFQIKELREDEKVRHQELLAAISAVEIACTKLAPQVSGQGAPSTIGAPEPSTLGAQPPLGQGPVGDIYQAAEMGSVPAAVVQQDLQLDLWGRQQHHVMADLQDMLLLLLWDLQAWLVRVQTAAGLQTRAVAPGGLRRGEPANSNWHSEFGLGTVQIGNGAYRILPDSFMRNATPYPGQ